MGSALPAAPFRDRALITEGWAISPSALLRGIARFGDQAWFDRVGFASYTTFDNATFDGDIGFHGTTLNGLPYRPPQLQSDWLSLEDTV